MRLKNFITAIPAIFVWPFKIPFRSHSLSLSHTHTHTVDLTNKVLGWDIAAGNLDITLSLSLLNALNLKSALTKLTHTHTHIRTHTHILSHTCLESVSDPCDHLA